MLKYLGTALPFAVAALVAGPASAGPALDNASSRIESIAGGELAAVAGGYADGAQLHWVGGPLDGTYVEPEAREDVWSKFFKAQGTQTATISNTSEVANPAGATVTADVTFVGSKKVNVRYVLVYRGDLLASEIWQVNPAK